MNNIKWLCPQCQQLNIIEPHSDPRAHYPSVVCEFCDYELEDCPCFTAAQSLGRKGGKSTQKKYGNEHFRELAKKRWKKV